MKLQKQEGFTLVELLVVVTIIGILSALAIPAYSNYVTRSKIPDATSNLAIKRVAMEQFFQDNHTYVGAPACNTDTTSSKFYTFSCTGAGAPTISSYLITAAGPNTDISMNGYTYTIDQNNNKTSAIASPADPSWIATSGTCWITKPGGLC